MSFIFVFLTILFLFIGFLSQPIGSSQNPLYQYAQTELNFLFQYRAIFIGLYFLIAIFYLRYIVTTTKSWLKRYGLSLVHVAALTFISWFASFALLLCIAWLELNIFAVLYDINPAATGITTDKKAIIQTLKKANSYPEVIASNTDQKQILIATAIATAGKSSVYGSSILPYIPTFLLLPVNKPASSVLMIANTLIITEINPTDLQDISPYVGYLLVKTYFYNRPIKAYAKVTAITEKEYQKVRDTDIAEKVQQLTKQLQQLKDTASTFSATLATDQATITSSDKQKKQAYKDRDKEYQQCLTTGSKASCQNILDTWQKVIDDADATNTKYQTKLDTDTDQQKLYAVYIDFLGQQTTAVASSTATIPHETGVFKPNNTVRIALFTSSSTALADYLETLTHEYLHYASYISPQKQFSSLFFEEGLTEYFARQAMQSSFNTSTNLGYPVFVRIIKQISKRIPDAELADIYFSKDENLLEKRLNDAYGDNFYADTRILFTAMQYASQPQQVLQIANTIMKRLGGRPLTQKDLQSTSSILK